MSHAINQRKKQKRPTLVQFKLDTDFFQLVNPVSYSVSEKLIQKHIFNHEEISLPQTIQ